MGSVPNCLAFFKMPGRPQIIPAGGCMRAAQRGLFLCWESLMFVVFRKFVSPISVGLILLSAATEHALLHKEEVIPS